MKITRNAAIRMFQTLGTMALGHLEDKTLESVMVNFNSFRKVHEDFEELKKELFKRLYGDLETMEEVEKKRITDFFDILGKMENQSSEKIAELDALAQGTYPDLYDVRKREINLIVSILNKEIEVDIEEVDADEFIKGIVRGKKDAPMLEIRALFAFMFKKEKRDSEKVDNFSELDELLKDIE